MSNTLEVDEILKLDENEEETSVEPQLEEEEEVTQHTIITSPWSRLGIIGLPLAGGFLIFYFMFNNIINGNSRASNQVKNPNTEAKQQNTVTEEQDGDVYAQLALAKQEEQLQKLREQKENQTAKITPTPSKNPTTDTEIKPVPRQSQPVQVKSSPPPPPQPRTYSSPPRAYSPPPTRISSLPAPPSFVTPKVTAATNLTQEKDLDPTTEFLRLRGIGSYGLVAYNTDTDTLKTAKPSSSFPDPAQSAPLPQTTRVQPRTTVPTAPTTPSNTNTIEKIRPRWQAEVKADKSVILASNYLPQESQILQERKTRYLTVGEFAAGVMVTPAVKQQTDTKNQQQQTDDGRRFVARLTEDLHDNYGDVAIPAGTLLAVELTSVDGGNYAQMQVVSIIKDNTEYPIGKGAIAVQGDKGKPLIAKKFHDKGGELASQDLTVALLGGLGKIGEIINRPDTNSSFQTSSIGSSSSVTTQNNRRNIAGAFLEGAFGETKDIVSERAQRSGQEILSRPDVYYIPRNTKVTFIVNRTLELP